MENLVEAEIELGAGVVVGEYQVEGQLGKGGFGAVYAAVHPLIGKRVAIKVLNRRFSADADIVSRFVAEARAVNQIRHQHIIDIFGFGKLPDGRQYYVMELLAGATLDKLVRDRGSLAPREAMQVLRPLARALDAAHAAGIAHRDLKPENVFVARDSEGRPFPKLLDFGIAKLLAPDDTAHHKTATGAPLGTPLYMSPEQCRGRAVDHRTDIYSFGVMSYQVLTGQLPFSGQDYMEILLHHMHDEPEPPSRRNPALPAAVDAAVAAMMAKDAGKRPQSLIAAVTALGSALGLAGETTLEPGLAETLTAGATTGGAVDPMARTHATPASGAMSRAPATGGGAAASGAATSGAAAGASAGVATRSRWPLVAVAVVAIGGVAAAVALSGRDGGTGGTGGAGVTGVTPSAGPAQPALAPDASIVAAHVAADAAPVAAPPIQASVRVTVSGPPAGTRVTTSDGRSLGTAPGTLDVPQGDAPLTLHFAHDGYQPLDHAIVPARDLILEVQLKKKRTARPGGPKPPDEIGDF